MNAALTVRPSTESASVTDTRNETLPAPPPPLPTPDEAHVESPREAAARAGLVLPSSRHRRWTTPVLVVAFVALVALPILAALPSSLVAEEYNPRLEVDQPAPYARTPASAQPVDDRIKFGDLGDVADQYPPEGDFYFVTVTEPSQSVLSWLLGREHPAAMQTLVQMQSHQRQLQPLGQSVQSLLLLER